MKKNFISQYFSLIIILAALIGIFFPSMFRSFGGVIPYLLALIMFSVGLHINISDFKYVVNLRYKIFIILFLKISCTAYLAYLIGKFLGLNLLELVGLVIVGTCPGGTAASVMALLSRANVTLAVCLTMITTILTPITMPLIIYSLFHESVELDWLGMAQTTFTIVIIPIALGLLVKKKNIFGPNALDIFTNIAIIAITLIVMIIVALNYNIILALPVKLILSVIILSILASFIGYIVGVMFNLDTASRKALLFEFSILDVGLGIVIATIFFGKEAAIAGVFYAVWQNIVGPIIANLLINKKGDKRK
ncbi:bile acid:sodium symporter family protein [Francisella frigiditurris]|uniref:Sodium Bile acid symporter family protein n=1 Tax=Francisella frigiditurris TaxID=1542390 RepID=A0A1J0KSB7_9GAMM|nr:bile acid:sodium symporter family protein [Francisella frigiditurris]APC96586.1 sodium Bile acid symporter family protein [Francisella frigiditurris]